MHVVHETAKLVISRRENLKKEKVCECLNMKNARAKRAKLLFFIVQYANLLTSSSWLLQLPNGKR